MKKYIVVYLGSAFVSALCLILPWILNYFDVISHYVDKHFWITSVIALVVSGIIVLRYIEKPLPRVILLLLNPAIGYAAFWLYVYISISSTPWNGFDKLVP